MTDPEHIWIAVASGSLVVLLSGLVFVLLVRRMLATFLGVVQDLVNRAKQDGEERLEDARRDGREVLERMQQTFQETLAEAIRDHLLAMEKAEAVAAKALSDALTHARSFDDVQRGLREIQSIHGARLAQLTAWREEHERRHDQEAAARAEALRKGLQP